MGFDVFPLSLLGGLAGLDRRALIQVAVSSPLVVSVLLGSLMGEPAMGLLVGAVVSLLWVHELPVGAAIPPDDTTVATVASLAACLLVRDAGLSTGASLTVGLLWATPFGLLARRLDIWSRQLNGGLMRQVLEASPEQQPALLRWAQWKGPVGTGLGSLLASAGGAGLGGWLLPILFRFLGPAEVRGLEWAAWLFPCLGVAAGVAAMNRRRGWAWFLLGWVGTSSLLYWRAFG